MKKLNALLIGFVLIGIVLISCKKERDESSTKSETLKLNLRVNNNMLVFNSIDKLDETIRYLNSMGDNNLVKFESNLSFNSMRVSLNEGKRRELGIEDDLLAAIINSDGEIQIGDNIFKLDIPNKNVLMVPARMYKNGVGFGNKEAVQTFSIYDDYEKIMERGTAKSSSCSRQKKGPYYWNVSGVEIKYKIVYQNAFFYHSLQAKIKKDNGTGGVVNISMFTLGKNFYKKNGDDNKINIPYANFGGNERVYHYRPYASVSTGLVAYKYDVQFSAYHVTTQQGWTAHLKITCGYSDGGGNSGGGGDCDGCPNPL